MYFMIIGVILLLTFLVLFPFKKKVVKPGTLVGGGSEVGPITEIAPFIKGSYIQFKEKPPIIIEEEIIEESTYPDLLSTIVALEVINEMTQDGSPQEVVVESPSIMEVYDSTSNDSVSSTDF